MSVWALGSNSSGQLGTGNEQDAHYLTPSVLPPQARIGNVVGGGNHVFGWPQDGTKLYGCGSNADGQLGEIHASDDGAQALVWRVTKQPEGQIRQVACGWSHSLLLMDGGKVYATGSNRYGQLGNESLGAAKWTAVDGMGDVVAVACGMRHSMAVTKAGQLYAWGANRSGQLGCSPKASIATPQCVSAGLPPIAMVSCGRNHSVAIAQDRRTVFVAGQDKYGQCGPSSDEFVAGTWRKFALPGVAQKLCCQWDSSAVLLRSAETGNVLMWGRADHGQLAAETSEGCSRALVSVPLLADDVACGSNHTLAKTSDGLVYSWGWNEHGNAGDPELHNVLAPHYSTAVFDGLSISVADLKQDILREQKLNPDDFDLIITNEQTNEDYKDDTTLIPKNTIVLVRRIPYTGPKMSRMAAANARQQQQGSGYTGMAYSGSQRPSGVPATGPGSQYGYRGPQGVGISINKANKPEQTNDGMETEMNDPEDAEIAAMLKQSNDQWMHQQSLMEMQRPVGRGGYRGRPPMRPEHRDPPPPGYVCHRCGMQGHWIYSCPTMSQAADGSGKPGMHRVKRTTGIPKSFLQKVDNLDEVGNALVTSDGTLVVATANEAAWETAQRMSRAAVSAEDIDGSLVPEELKCNLCKKLARDAVIAPCCKTVFCSSCIESQLLEPGLMHFTCPQCRSGLVPDQLEVAKDTRGKVDEFLRDFSSKNVAEETEEKPGDSANGDRNGAASGDTSAEAAANGAQAPPPATAAMPNAAATTTTAPAAANVQRPPAQIPPRPRPMNMMPGMMMGGFPGMPMAMGQMPFMPGMMPGMMPPMPANSMGQWGNKASGDSAAGSDKEMRSPHRSSSRRPRSRSRSTRRRSRSRDSRDRHARGRDVSRASRDGRSRREYSRDRSPRRRRDSRSRYRDDSRERRGSRYDDRRRRDRYRSGRSRSPASRDHSSHSDARSSRKSSHRDEVSIRGQSTNSADKPRSIADRLNDTRSTDAAKAQESSGRRRRRRRR
ncbi:Retinoblastoma-binding protein [Coemansia sp. RSA 2336]|nr:Retinoblastoma-binding protein [Coemansia sp. RSA 2336]